jgi:hypothetical protein
MRSFAHSAAWHIKDAYDSTGQQVPLVSLGTMGIGQCGVSWRFLPGTTANGTQPGITEFKFVHSSPNPNVPPNVDICEIHDYDAYTEALPTDWYDEGVNGSNSMTRRLSECDNPQRPFFVGEVGIKANVSQGVKCAHEPVCGWFPVDHPDPGDNSITTTTLNRRANLLEDKMLAAFGAGSDGWIAWSKIMQKSSARRNYRYYADTGTYADHFGIGPGDPFEARFRNCAKVLMTCGANGTPADAGAPYPEADFTLRNRHDYQDGNDSDWQVDWPANGFTLTFDTGLNHTPSDQIEAGDTGTAFAVDVSPLDYEQMRTCDPELSELTQGKQVSGWIHTSSSTSSVRARFYAKDEDYDDYAWQDSFQELTDGWTKITWTRPALGDTNAVGCLGIQIENLDPDGSGPQQRQQGFVHIDDVEW